MWNVEFYRTMDGECPTEDFLKSLRQPNERKHAVHALDLLKEFGHDLRRPHTDLLENGIYELRIHVQGKQFRLLYFFFFQDSIIISHGLKKEAKVPEIEI